MQALEKLQQIDRSTEIDGWNVRIYFACRNPRVLMAIAFAILAIATGIGWIVQRPMAKAFGAKLGGEDLKAELGQPHPDMERIVEMMPEAVFANDSLQNAIATSQLSQTEKMVATALWTSLHDGDGFEPSADLLYYAHYIKPLRYANELIGDHYLETDEPEQAAAYYRREAKFADAREARAKLVQLYAAKHDRAGLRALADDPSFSGSFMPEHKLYFAASEHRWADLVAPLRDLQARLLKPVPMALAAIAGLAWFLVAWQMIQPPNLFGFRTIAPVLAVLAGMGSTFATLLASIWMEEIFGLAESRELFANLAFYMLGVGPREEIVKLIFFVPFVPLLLARKSRLEMLVVAGCVGLGFAIWENLLYFAQAGPVAAFPRFLTANFFHFVLTAFNGLALCDALREPRRIPAFVGTLLGTSFAHGLYDALQGVHELAALLGNSKLMAMPAMIVFMLMSLFFFRKLQTLRNGSTDQLCIAATLVAGLSLLGGAVLVFAAREMGLVPALVVLAVTGLFWVMVVYMFYWQLGEGMSIGMSETGERHAA
jgi:RsiW-degrading membrane proteinase PrsW (M82 family)